MAVENEVKSDSAALHDAVSEAYDEVVAAAGAEPVSRPNQPEDTPEAPPSPETPEPPTEEVPADEPAPGERRDPKTGKFLPREKAPETPEPAKSPAAKPPIPGQPLAKPVAPAAKPLAPPTPPDPLGRAPQSWKPQAREAYAALGKLGEEGRAIREEIHRRDREVMTTLQKTAEQRAFSEEFNKVMQPFAPIIAANGHTPLQSVQGLMQTAAALQMGPPGQKAMIAANIIRSYGIDIDMLAQALESGGLPQQMPPTAAPGQVYDPRVDQFLADQKRREEAAAKQQEQALLAKYEEFAKTHEFFEDVRGLMATIVSVKSEQEGVDIDDEEAYTMALALRPDLTKIIRDREELAQATRPNSPTARAAAAAVSLQPGSLAVHKAADPNDLHAILSESYDEVIGKK